MIQRKSAVQIIQETIEYYSADPVGRRGKNGGACVYISDEGEMCAVGRCMEDPNLVSAQNVCSNMALSIGGKAPLEELLKEEYRGHPISFWGSLQRIHDQDEYWCEAGLTELGRTRVTQLIDFYKSEE